MPWLTTHITVPLILVTGWWLGRVAGKIRWRELDVSEWLVLLVALPLAFVAFGQVIVGFWGANPPLRRARRRQTCWPAGTGWPRC